MANYYYVTIKSDKMTQEVANKIFQRLSTLNLIRHFSFVEGHLTYNTRGLTDIVDILEEYGFTDKDIEVKDEFELAYEQNDTQIKTNITLHDFLNITNIENTHIYTNIEERKDCFRLILITAPKTGFNQNNFSKLKSLKIKEIYFQNDIIEIELEKYNNAST